MPNGTYERIKKISDTLPLIMADEPVAVANTLASPLGPDRVGQVGENFRAFCCLNLNNAKKCTPLVFKKVRKVGGRATWSLSSCKPGFGVEQLRDDRCVTILCLQELEHIFLGHWPMEFSLFGCNLSLRCISVEKRTGNLVVNCPTWSMSR